MKISKIETIILKVPLGSQRFYSSQCAFPERNSMLVRITAENGLTGWGECGQYGPAEPVAACIEHVLAPRVIGRDVHPTQLWEEMYAGTRDFGQKGSYIEAISGIDIALWDLLGRHLKAPVSTLLGGACRTSIGSYATGCYYRGEDHLDYRESLPKLAAEAKSYVDAGFRMLKIKVGLLRIEQDVERVAAIRDAIGKEVELLVDANHSYNAFNAVRMAKELARFDVRWFEEPVPPEDRSGYREVRKFSLIPVAGGECEYTRYGFRDFISEGCVDIVQPDVCVCGGLSEFMKIHALASSFGIAVIPHVWGSGIALAAALQAIAVLPLFPHTANPVGLQNEPVIEYDRNHNPLRDDLLVEQFTLVDGRVPVPQTPGLGVTVKEDVLKKYTTRHQTIGG
jgi:D-galactarolactone cycloisomerase